MNNNIQGKQRIYIKAVVQKAFCKEFDLRDMY